MTGTPKSASSSSCSSCSSDPGDTPPRASTRDVHQRDVLDALPERALRNVAGLYASNRMILRHDHHRMPRRRRRIHSAHNSNIASAYAHPAPRSRGAASADTRAAHAVAGDARRARQPLARRIHREQRRAPRVVTSYTPGRQRRRLHHTDCRREPERQRIHARRTTLLHARPTRPNRSPIRAASAPDRRRERVARRARRRDGRRAPRRASRRCFPTTR